MQLQLILVPTIYKQFPVYTACVYYLLQKHFIVIIYLEAAMSKFAISNNNEIDAAYGVSER